MAGCGCKECGDKESKIELFGDNGALASSSTMDTVGVVVFVLALLAFIYFWLQTTGKLGPIVLFVKDTFVKNTRN
jgi:uncharacterized membrane protein YkgB